MSSRADPSRRLSPAGRCSRRRFLGGAAVLLPGWLVVGCEPLTAPRVADRSSVLQALALRVLPRGALGDDAVVDAVSRFESWWEGFVPEANLDHPYLSTDELNYGPPDPRPRWGEQLDALELEAEARHDRRFAELPGEAQAELLERQLPGDLAADLPWAPTAPHVAVALLSWYYATPGANDLCYERRIERHGCRGVPGVGALPAPLGDASTGGVVTGEAGS